MSVSLETNRSNDVHRGRDGWLFLAGGSNHVFDLFNEKGGFDEQKNIAWSSLLKERFARARMFGADYMHMVVPDKATLYADKSGLEGIGFANSALRRHYDLARRSGFGELIDCVTPMARQKRRRDLFYKTDSHWNYQGCLCAYLEFCRMAGAIPAAHVLASPFQAGMALLDLGSRLTEQPREEFRVYTFFSRAKRVFANAMVDYKERNNCENDGRLHVGSQVVFRNDDAAADPRRVILFGDSFAEYRTHLLTGMLAETFSETHFVWSSAIDWSYVAAHKPDLLATEMAERFLTILPQDDLELEQFVRTRLSEIEAG